MKKLLIVLLWKYINLHQHFTLKVSLLLETEAHLFSLVYTVYLKSNINLHFGAITTLPKVDFYNMLPVYEDYERAVSDVINICT